MREISALLCISFDKRDREIRDKIKELLESFNFDVEIIDYKHSSEDLNTLIEEKMKEKEAIFVVFTSSGSDWVRDEAITAYLKRRNSLFIFFEDDFKKFAIGKLEKKDYAFAVFERKNFYQELVEKGAIKSLQGFRENLFLSKYNIDFEYELIETQTEILSEKEVKVSEKRHLVVVNKEAEIEEDIYITRVDKENETINVIDVKFIPLLYPSNKDIDCDEIKHEKEFRIVVRINPPLKYEENLIYSFSYKVDNNKAYYKEEVDNSNAMRSIYRNTSYVWKIRTVRKPIKYLKQIVKFPLGYDVDKYGIFVTGEKDSNRFLQEENRVIYEKRTDIDGKVELIMVVHNAKVGYSYHLWWEPPSKEKVEDKGNE